MTKSKFNQCFIVAIASGKGGVGKSIATVNTAEMLVRLGYKVAVVDADLGLSNCAALLNESVPATVMDIKKGRCDVEDVMLKTQGDFTLVTGADEPESDVLDWSELYTSLDQVLRKLRLENDFILIDTPAGASDLSFWALDRADMGVLVVVGEPTAISDVYRFCKFVLDVDPTYPFAAVVNFAEDENEAQNVLERFNTIVRHFMNREFSYLGYIPLDDLVRNSVTDQFPVVRAHPEHQVTKELEYIASALVGISKKNEKNPVTTSTEAEVSNQ